MNFRGDFSTASRRQQKVNISQRIGIEAGEVDFATHQLDSTSNEYFTRDLAIHDHE